MPEFQVNTEDIKTVKYLLRVTDSYDPVDILEWACVNNHEEVVKELISINGDLFGMCSPCETTSLQLAAQHNNLTLGTILLDANIPVNITNVYGETALDYAFRKNHTDFMKLLISRGANVNHMCMCDTSDILVGAIDDNQEEGIMMLIEAGYVPSDKEMTIIQLREHLSHKVAERVIARF
jgi:ankyrin repeat protein